MGIFHVTSRTQNKPLSNFHDSHARLPCALTRSLSILACWSKTWPNCIEGQQGLLGCHRVPTKRSEIIINYVRNMAKIYNDDLQEATSKASKPTLFPSEKKLLMLYRQEISQISSTRCAIAPGGRYADMQAPTIFGK